MKVNYVLSRIVVLICGVVLVLSCPGCKSKSQPAEKPTTEQPASEVMKDDEPEDIESPAPKRKPQRWALLIHYAGGFKPVLVDHNGWKKEHVIVVSDPTTQKVAEAFARIPTLTRDDLFFFACCHHAAPGYLFNRQWPWDKVEEQFKRIGATDIVALDICHGGLAIEHVPSAEMVYSACNSLNKTGGVFQRFFIAAMVDPASDANNDGYISMGEAYEKASRRKPLQKEYANLHKSNPRFWPVPHGPRPVCSAGALLRGDEVCLQADWDLSLKEPKE